MVRFKGVILDRLPIEALVSIPLWCDLKDVAANVHTSRNFVSIPLWCDLKVL